VVEEYAELKRAVEAAGFFTTFQPIKKRGDRIVCASQGGSWGIGGRSFWIAMRQGRWFLATWTPRTYEIRDPAEVSLAAMEVRTSNDPRCYDVDEGIKERFGLVEVDDEEFEGLK
jgi:hypothetical protein